MSGRKHVIFMIVICLAVAGCRASQLSELERIHAQKSSTLVAWLNGKQLPEDMPITNLDLSFFAAISDELAARHEVNFLLNQLNATNSPEGREWLVSDALFSINDRRIYNAFSERLSDDEGRDSYYIALYLAERGNVRALATLNRHYFNYPVASFEWAEAVDAFGKFRYMPAASNVVDSLDAASFNLVGAALSALQNMFPNSPRQFRDLPAAEAYFAKRLKGITAKQAASRAP